MQWRRPQPDHWQSLIEARDGADSNPEVVIYRSTQPRTKYQLVRPSILDPSSRVEFRQDPCEGESSVPFVFPADMELATGTGQWKSMMVFVKRGRGVDYQEKGNSPFADPDIRRDLPGRSWQEIRSFRIQYPDGYNGQEERNNRTMIQQSFTLPRQVDFYTDVDWDL